MLAIFGLVFISLVATLANGQNANANVNAKENANTNAHKSTTPPPSKTTVAPKTKKTHATKPPKNPPLSTTTTTAKPAAVKAAAPVVAAPVQAPVGAGKPTPTPKPGKVNCGACQGVGDDCKPTYYDKNVDYCCKVTGIVDDPKKVSPIIAFLLNAGGGNVQNQMTKYKGKKAVVRKGIALSSLSLAGMQGDPGPGCSDYPSFAGLKDATACICYDDCP